MTPGTLVLLSAPSPLADALRALGRTVLAPDVAEPAAVPHRYVAAHALALNAASPAAPLVLIACGPAGPLLPALALAQRAAKRPIAGYVVVDSELPEPAGDWPDAPCAYLSTLPDDPRLKQALLRAWHTTSCPPTALPTTLDTLLKAL
ncbi:hypothetical protein GCM10027589_18280 [Actinocorallia lasiicapitis]